MSLMTNEEEFPNEIEELEDVVPVREIDLNERADCCGVMPIVVATREDRKLQFCLHHSKDHKDALVSKGWEVNPDAEMMEVIGAKFS